MRTHPADTDQRAGIAFAAVAALAFATLPIFGKYAYREGADAVALLAGRFAVASFLIGGYAVAAGASLRVGRRRLVHLLALGAAGYGGEATLYFVALQHAPAGTVSLIFYSYPLWTTLIAIAAGLERPRLRLFAALGLGTGGVALTFSVSLDEPRGPLLALGAAVAVALYFTLAEIVARGVPASVAALWTSVGATAALGVIAVAGSRPLPGAAAAWAGALGVATSVAFVAMFAALARVGSARASVATMLEPVGTIALAALLLGEEPGINVLVGAALVVAALPVLAGAGRREGSPPEADAL